MTQERVHLILIWAWVAQFVGAIVCLFLAWYTDVEATTFFLLSVGYVSLCSIYANIASHWAAWEAARAAEKVEEQ